MPGSKAATTSDSKASPRGRCSPRSAASSSTSTPTSCLPCRCRPRRRSLWRSAVSALAVDGARIAYAVSWRGGSRSSRRRTGLPTWVTTGRARFMVTGISPTRAVKQAGAFGHGGVRQVRVGTAQFRFRTSGLRSRSGDRSSRPGAMRSSGKFLTARRSRLLMPRGTRSGVRKARPGQQFRCGMGGRRISGGDRVARNSFWRSTDASLAFAGACSGRCSSRSISLRPTSR